MRILLDFSCLFNTCNVCISHIKTSSAELVYGEPLKLPGEMLISTLRNTVAEDPSTLLPRLRKIIEKLRPSPASRHSQPKTFIFSDGRQVPACNMSVNSFLATANFSLFNRRG